MPVPHHGFFCPKNTLISLLYALKREITPRNVALKSINDLFWCAKNHLHINWLNLEQFPL